MSSYRPSRGDWDGDHPSPDTVRWAENLSRMPDALMRIVHSRLDDDDALERMRPIVAGDPSTAAIALESVTKVCESDSGYLPDRAHRLLVAAINDTPPAPTSPDHADLYEREQELGWRPLQDAFAQLRDALRELSQIIERGKASSETTSAHTDHGSYGTFSHSLVPSEPWQDLGTILGPNSQHGDRLLRSKLALAIATHYFDAVTDQPDALDPERALWEWAPADGTDPPPWPQAFRL